MIKCKRVYSKIFQLLFLINACAVSIPLSAEEPLERFFSELSSLKIGKDTVVSIVHLGDSHIQAGYYKQAEMIYNVFIKAFNFSQYKKYSSTITHPDLI